MCSACSWWFSFGNPGLIIIPCALQGMHLPQAKVDETGTSTARARSHSVFVGLGVRDREEQGLRADMQRVTRRRFIKGSVLAGAAAETVRGTVARAQAGRIK